MGLKGDESVWGIVSGACYPVGDRLWLGRRLLVVFTRNRIGSCLNLESWDSSLTSLNSFFWVCLPLTEKSLSGTPSHYLFLANQPRRTRLSAWGTPGHGNTGIKCWSDNRCQFWKANFISLLAKGARHLGTVSLSSAWAEPVYVTGKAQATLVNSDRRSDEGTCWLTP